MSAFVNASLFPNYVFSFNFFLADGGVDFYIVIFLSIHHVKCLRKKLTLRLQGKHSKTF